MRLIEKNVSEEASGKICENLNKKLQNQKFGFFSSCYKVVKEELKVTLEKILIP